MEVLRDKLIVKFENNKVYKLSNGLELVKSDIYVWEDGEGDNSMEGKVNKLETNPQTAEVLFTNSKHKVEKGEKVFLHYMAYEWHEEYEYEGETYAVVDANYIIFKFNKEGKITLKDNTFLGEVILEDKMTLSGLIIDINETRRAAEIKITHTPEIVDRELSSIKVGDTVKTIDDNQYILKFGDKKVVKLQSSEIVALML